MTQHAFLIPEGNLPLLQQKLDRLNKRADKVGCPRITMTTYPDYPTMREVKEYSEIEGKDVVKYIVKLIPTVIEGETPKYAGWTFLASLTNTLEGTLAMVTPGETLPKQYYNATSDCDHCKTNRFRSKIYVISTEIGGKLVTKQVGSTCIQDFLGGADPEDYAKFAEFYGSLMLAFSDAEDADSEERGPRGEYLYALENFLIVTAFVIRCTGWLSKGKAREMGESGSATVNTVEIYIGSNDYRKHFEKEYGEPNDADVERANAAIAWAQEIPEDDSSDYLRNLGIIARLEACSPRFTGFAASMLQAHRNAIEKQAQAEHKQSQRERSTSVHVGSPKQRLELTLTVMGITECEGYMGGLAHFVRFEDQDGNQFTWFASRETDMEIGNTYNVKGTVKDHTEYKGVPQTRLTRVAVQEEK